MWLQQKFVIETQRLNNFFMQISLETTEHTLQQGYFESFLLSRYKMRETVRNLSAWAAQIVLFVASHKAEEMTKFVGDVLFSNLFHK